MQVPQHTIDRIATGEEIHQMTVNFIRRLLFLPIRRTPEQAYAEAVRKYSST